MHEVMDLCLQCKGCKAECPSNVDMAKLKSEFLSLYHSARGHSLRSELFANIELINRLGCALAPLSNWLVNLPIVKFATHHFFGIHYHRSFPPFARPTFEEWFRQRRRLVDNQAGGNTANPSSQTKRVVLFHDCFLNYNHPHVGISAVRLLEALGYEVILPEKKCCGRPMISKGFLDKARQNAQHNIEALGRYVERGWEVVGCEPSCILTFRDEYPDLIPGSGARQLAEHSFLIEEFLDKHIIEGKLTLSFRPRHVLLHGHCHQKAITGTGPLVRVLQAAGFTVEEIDSGCCGMAGSFGFEKEHYAISIAIGSLRLFGAIRSAPPDVEVLAPGTSCRQQIADGTGRAAKHPVELLAESLVS
jgi:Fe-S oxidoreductase